MPAIRAAHVLLYSFTQSTIMAPDFDGDLGGAIGGGGSGDTSALGCGSHLIVIGMLVLLVIGLMKWLG